MQRAVGAHGDGGPGNIDRCKAKLENASESAAPEPTPGTDDETDVSMFFDGRSAGVVWAGRF